MVSPYDGQHRYWFRALALLAPSPRPADSSTQQGPGSQLSQINTCPFLDRLNWSLWHREVTLELSWVGGSHQGL